MNKKINEYTQEEWENICNHCGKCCLLKLQNEDTGEIYYTDVVCRYYDQEQSRCSIYEKRCEIVPECLKLTPENIDKIEWMPQSCAYRRLFEGKKDTGKTTTIKGRCISEDLVKEEELEDHIIDWEDL